MYQFFQDLTRYALPVFVIATMFNVGLTQQPSAIGDNLRNWHFLVRMLLANFIIVPSLMYTLVNLVGDYTPAEAAGLMIMGVCAGAPFLIKLTQTSENDIALGATVMLVLMIATVVVAPVLLPFFIKGLDVDAWGIAQSLFLQMLLPIIVGMILAQAVSSFAEMIQPSVARIGNIALYVVLGATLVGYWPDIQDLIGTGSIAGGLVVLLIARFLSRDSGDASEDDPEHGDNRMFVDQRYMRVNRPARKRATVAEASINPSARS